MDPANDYEDTSGYNELFLAVHNGDLDLVQSLLKKYSETETIRGRTLLHVATVRGHTEIAKKLLDNGATIKVEDIKGNTPLDVSLATGNVPIAEILFNNGAVLSEKDLSNMVPLCKAVKEGNFEMVKLLMKNGCNAIEISKCDCSAPKLALLSGRLDILEYLLMNGVKSITTVKEDKLGLFRSVISRGGLDDLKYLVDIGIKVQNLEELFQVTFISGRHDMWKYLVTRLSKINAKTYFNEKQLHSSIRMGQLESVKKIVNEPSNGYESDTFARQLAVQIAVESGSEEILEILLNAGYPVNDSAFKFISPLHLAATFEHPRLVNLLLKAGADINLQTEDPGRTPLHFAATAAQPAVVNFLLKNGADPFKTCKFGESPIRTALEIHSGLYHEFFPLTPVVFERLLKVTEMLMRYSDSITNEQLFEYAVKIRVSSIENSKPISRRLMTVGDSVFRPEIVRCICNYLQEDEVKYFFETVFEDSSYYPPELLQLIMDYRNNSISCFDIKINPWFENVMCQSLLIGYSKNVDNLLGSISDIISDYDPDCYNDEEESNVLDLLKLLVSRLVLLNTNCDLTQFQGKYKLINDLIEWQENCVQEKIVMQTTKVNEKFNFTFYDVLTKSIDKVAGHASNEDFFIAMKSSEIKFPIYANFLKANVEVAERKRDCIDECTTLMNRMVEKCYKIKISNSDIRHILQYLSLVDLRRLSAACS